uniref:Uncharacterized protein n=1 Tax=Anguilla anguilla TaxID=7936 RepID=A0A0E9VCV5_ANGAN
MKKIPLRIFSGKNCLQHI